jgi:hypothetical protein
MFPLYNAFRDDQEQAMPRRVLPRASGVVSGNNGVTQNVEQGASVGGGYEEQAARLLKQSTEAMDRYRGLRDRPVDYTQLQELAKQRGMEGEDAMLTALAAQFAGPQYEGLQGALLKRSMASREPIKTARGMVTAEGFTADPDALQADELQGAREEMEFSGQQYNKVLTASQQAEQRREQERQREEGKERDRQLRRELPSLVAAARGSGGGGGGAVTPVTVRRDGRDVIIDGRSGRLIGDAPPKDGGSRPLPATVQKMVQESVEGIGTASAIQSDLAGFVAQLDAGSLKLGPVSNLVSRGRSRLNMSDQQAVNFESFTANLERLRNESLRLNKGVQTDGDAQRAWNENFPSLTDQNAVAQRLREIIAINERAVALRQMQVDRIYTEYGREPPDLSRFTQLPGATNLPRPGALGSGTTGNPAPGQTLNLQPAPNAAGGLTPQEQAELQALRQRLGR